MKTRPSTSAGVSEGHNVETTQRPPHLGAGRLLGRGVVAIATEPAAYLRGPSEGSNTRPAVGVATVSTSRRCPSRLMCSPSPSALGCMSGAGVAPVSSFVDGSDTRVGAEKTCRLHVRSTGVMVAVPFEGAFRQVERTQHGPETGWSTVMNRFRSRLVVEAAYPRAGKQSHTREVWC